MGNSSIYRAGTLPNKFNYEHKTLTATCCPEFTALTAICIEVHPAQVIAVRRKLHSRVVTSRNVSHADAF